MPQRKVTVIEPEGPAPWSEDGFFVDWRTQAVAFLDEIVEALNLQDDAVLISELAALRLEDLGRGKRQAAPGRLPLADALLLTLAPLLREKKGYRIRFSGGPREFSLRRQLRLESLLSGGEVLPYVAASPTMTEETWEALTGRHRE
jgi:hypothetical protein